MTISLPRNHPIILATSLLIAAGSAPALADTLIDHVDGFTLTEDGKVERLDGLLIGNDGKVLRVLHRGDKRPAKVDYLLDGKGRVLMPGLIDAHVHVMEVGLGALTLDLSTTRSLAEAQEKIAAYAAAHPDHPWILGRGWNQEVWGLGRFPTAAELDAVVKDRPVWLSRADGHAGWANSAALAAAGVSAATQPPVGGRIERVGANQQPAGVLVDAAQELVGRVVPQPRPEDRDLAFAKAQELFLKRGLTAVADMGASIEDWQAFRRSGDLGALRIRIMAYAAGTEAMTLIAGSQPSPWLYDDKLRLGGVKLYLDGALGSRGALLKAPYADAPGQSGLPLLNEAQLRNLMSRAALDKFQVAVHAIGDKANARVLDAIAELSETYKGDRRWRIEHAQVIDPVDLPRLGQHGTIASMQPVHQTSDRLMAEARLGPARLNGAYAWASALKAGGRLAFGSDAPVELPDPWAGLAAAITRQDENGQPYGGWQPQERVTREDALAAYTTGAAYAGFAETRFGRLAPGLRADFILVDRDPLMVSSSELRATRVLETWVGGQKVWSAETASTP
ncbi:amidohydrolase [Novosphingobium aerophilum]|uniref:Amidohydrolase n=1 Tax=Novosphingobium aerophilum TaxID=2839843 RepID=A0A7X1F5U3_9SPHN|nr:amidohydrolase [Novosphingobium aerophilum]MBC2650957.1 amidohydrolase [Novosphingobium aerophilum]